MEGSLSGLEKKYCMLHDKLFILFDEDKLHMRKPALILNFDLQWFVAEVPDRNSLNFTYALLTARLKEANRNFSFHFMADSFFSKDKWLSSLQTNLESSCGVREKLLKLSRIPQFWKVHPPHADPSDLRRSALQPREERGHHSVQGPELQLDHTAVLHQQRVG